MELRKFIATTIREYLNEQQMLRENLDLSTFDNAKDVTLPGTSNIFDNESNVKIIEIVGIANNGNNLSDIFVNKHGIGPATL